LILLSRLVAMGRMRTIILEDCALFRGLLIKACESDLGCRVVGEADDGLAGKALIEAQRPELLISDLNMPGCHGVEVARHCRECSPGTRILLMSSHSDDFAIGLIDPSLVDGFVAKNTEAVEAFRDAVKMMRAGKRFFSPASLEHKLGRLVTAGDPLLIPTEREFAALSLIGEGLSDEEVAERLEISVNTARTHRGRIMRKLKIEGSTKLSVFALRHGLARLDGPQK
jgi:DNA-binding NarL/FixJ family response regulator